MEVSKFDSFHPPQSKLPKISFLYFYDLKKNLSMITILDIKFFVKICIKVQENCKKKNPREKFKKGHQTAESVRL